MKYRKKDRTIVTRSCVITKTGGLEQMITRKEDHPCRTNELILSSPAMDSYHRALLSSPAIHDGQQRKTISNADGTRGAIILHVILMIVTLLLSIASLL